jgi:hypothetical protein
MELDNIYKYLGLAVIILVVVYVVMRSLTFQARLIEGMKSKDKEEETTTDKDKIPDAIKSKTNRILDSLLIDKYRSSYDDTIIEMEEYINVAILKSIIDYHAILTSDNGKPEEAMAIMTILNNFQAFKATLNDSMKYLDGIKSSNSGKSGKFF